MEGEQKMKLLPCHRGGEGVAKFRRVQCQASVGGWRGRQNLENPLRMQKGSDTTPAICHRTAFSVAVFCPHLPPNGKKTVLLGAAFDPERAKRYPSPHQSKSCCQPAASCGKLLPPAPSPTCTAGKNRVESPPENAPPCPILPAPATFSARPRPPPSRHAAAPSRPRIFPGGTHERRVNR